MEDLKDADANARPVRFMQIEPVGMRDGRCGACPLLPPSGAREDGAPAFMHFNVFRASADCLAPGADLHFHGQADPLLHLHLFDMVRHAAARGIRVWVHTDLSVLTEARAADCAGSGLHAMLVRLDGATAATYEAMRGRDRFERVLRNLRRLMRARRSCASRMQVELVALAARGNLHELPDLVSLAHEEGVAALTVRQPCQQACAPAEAGLSGLQREDAQRLQHWFDQARARAAALGVALVLPALRRRLHQPRPNGRRRCDPPWRGSYIGYDGQAIPSCMAALASDIGDGRGLAPAPLFLSGA